eukprot:SAG25_NODE_8733_length_407_cov_0.691558_1_plen_31_part_01
MHDIVSVCIHVAVRTISHEKVLGLHEYIHNI